MTRYRSWLAQQSSEVLLSTAFIIVKDKHGNLHICHILLDSGLQLSFISQDFANLSKISQQKTNTSLVGIDNVSSFSNYILQVNVSSKYNQFHINISSLVMNKILECLPLSIKSLKNMKLSDPNFCISSAVDILKRVEVNWSLLNLWISHKQHTLLINVA